MKKSEMINIIRSVIKLNHADDAYAFQRADISLGAFADRLSVSILERLEKEGMEPPLYEEGFVVCYPDYEGDAITDVRPVNKWEPE